jgi:hypothetical protein
MGFASMHVRSTGGVARSQVHRSMNELRALAPNSGSYVSESNFFEADWRHSYWGSNYPPLASVKKKYDPSGLFFVHNGVGSEEWSAVQFRTTERSVLQGIRLAWPSP